MKKFILLLLLAMPIVCFANRQDNDFSYKDGISLKEYIDLRVLNMKEGVALAHAALEKRLDSMNEFRDTIRDQASGFATKTDYIYTQKEIEDLKLSRAELKGGPSRVEVYIAYLISFIGIALQFLKRNEK